MAKLISTLFISADGVAEIDPAWHFPYFDENMGRAVSEDYDTADVLLLGRETYDSFAEAWPEREAAGGEDAPFAKQLGDLRKVVVSRQELPLTWRNPPSWPRVRRGGRVDDSAHLLAAVAARRARLDALRDLQGVYQPAGRIRRGDGGCAPHGGAAVAVAPIISRGPAGGDSLDDAARLVGMNLDWSIISAWK